MKTRTLTRMKSSNFKLFGKEYKKVQDAEAVEDLQILSQKKAFHFRSDYTADDRLHSAKLAGFIKEDFRRLSPLYRLLCSVRENT